MKLTSGIAFIVVLFASGFAMAQSAVMNHENMSGMQHTEMPVANAGKNAHDNRQIEQPVQATAIVKAVNPAKGSVTLAHEAIASLKWPPMTMNFIVKDNKLFDKLVVGKKVNVELIKDGTDYVVIRVK